MWKWRKGIDKRWWVISKFFELLEKLLFLSLNWLLNSKISNKKKKKKGVEKYRGLSLFFVSHLSPKASAKKKQKAMVKRGNQIKGLKGEISKSKFGLKTAQTKAIQCIYLYICGTLTMDLILQFQQGKFFNWAFIFSIQHSHV